MFSLPLFRVPPVAAMALGLCLIVAAPRPAAAGEATTAGVERLMTDAGITFERKSSSVWVVPRTGNALGKFQVIVTYQSDLLVLFVIVAKNGSFTTGEDALRKIIRFNYDDDRVKVGLDADSDLYVRSDVSIRVTDPREARALIDQVAAAADEVRAGMAPYFKP